MKRQTSTTNSGESTLDPSTSIRGPLPLPPSAILTDSPDGDCRWEETLHELGKLVEQEAEVEMAAGTAEPGQACEVALSDTSETLSLESSRKTKSVAGPLKLELASDAHPDEAQLAEIEEVSQQLEDAQPWEILKWTVDSFGDGFTVATAFGAEGMLILHWLAEVAPQTRIFNLDTGYQFPETLAMVDRIRQRYGLEIELVRPELSVQQYEQLHKGPVYRDRPDQCCNDRKLVPLRRRLEGATAWASAIRRDQSPDRAKAPIVGWDRKFRLIKVSPLANWNKAQVWKTILDQKVPYNPLHDQGYPSVGCQPCTRCVLAGEDERAGRWSGSKKTECGLHTWS